MKPVYRLPVCCETLAALGLLAAASFAADVVSTWNGTAGNWSDATRWNTNPLFPDNGNGGFTYDAVIGSGSVTLDQDITIEKFNLNGTLTGTSAFTLTLNDLFTWTGGFVRGPGIVQADGGMNISGVTKSLRGGRTLNNAGIANWTAANINSGEGAIFNNQAGATFDTNFDGSFTHAEGGALPQFNNAGSFIKSGGVGTTNFDGSFNNTGTVNINSGTLGLSGGGSSSGVFAAGGGATLNFSGSSSITHNLNTGTAVSGAGTVQVSGGIWNFNAGTYNVIGATTVSGGVANFNAAANSVALNLSSGTLGGTGNLTVNGLLTLTGGTMRDAGSTQANGGMNISGVTKVLRGGRTLNNAGIANWTAAIVNCGEGAIFNNQAGATFDTNFDGSFSQTQGGALTQFNNAGTFTKSGGLGTTNFSVGFNNTGAVNANSGTLSFTGGYTQIAGSLVLNGGAVSTNTALSIQGGSVRGNGTITGNVANDGTIAPGFSAGEMAITGNLSLGSNAIYAAEIGGTAQGTDYDFLSEAGNVALNLNGLLSLTLINNFAPAPTDTFRILRSNSDLLGQFANVASGIRLMTTDGLGSFQVNYGVGSMFDTREIVLSDFGIGLPGDYNQNGTVDAADYTLWRDNLGSLTSLPNDDTAGVATDDYTRWKANFGASLGSGNGAATDLAVPEPTSLVLLLAHLAPATLGIWRPRARTCKK